jgi:allantoin racemase
MDNAVKICIIAPVIIEGGTPPSVLAFAPAARPGCEVEVVFLDHGPASIESEFEEAMAVPDTIVKAVLAEEDGADAVVIDCMLDPGLDAVREKVSIPVIGPAQASMHLAAMLGDRFSIITVVDRLVAPFRKRARLYGVLDRLASVRSIEVSVLELEHDREATINPLVKEALAAIEVDGADVLIFGCTGMSGLAAAVQDGLQAHGHTDVPVIDPGIVALKLAETLVDLKLAQSKRTYPTPPTKLLVGFPGH